MTDGNTKEDILKNVQELMDPIDFHNGETDDMEVNGVHQLCGHSYSLKYLLLCPAEEIYSHRYETT